jgi:hypothetical protein
MKMTEHLEDVNEEQNKEDSQEDTEETSSRNKYIFYTLITIVMTKKKTQKKR